MDTYMLSRYPFLPEIKEFLKDISLNELLTSDYYYDARRLGFERVRAALTGERVTLPAPISSEAIMLRILSFTVARLLLIGLGDPLITRKFANVERDNLERTLLQFNKDIDTVADAFSIRFRRTNTPGKEFTVYFIDYIRQAKKFSGPEFRLAYQDLNRGWLPISTENFIKIIREAFVEHFVKDVEEQSHGELLAKAFKGEIEELRTLKDEYVSKYSTVDFGEVNSDAFPPCMNATISKIKAGINVSHEARFSLVAFLHKIGMSNEDILKIFASVPDFRKDITEYQVKHITGEISGKEYSVPKCSTMRSFGICARDMAKESLCYKKWMSHPLLYYKIKNEQLRKEHARQKQNAESQ